MENWEIVGGGGGEGVHIATSVLKGQWLEISHIGGVDDCREIYVNNHICYSINLFIVESAKKLDSKY